MLLVPFVVAVTVFISQGRTFGGLLSPRAGLFGDDVVTTDDALEAAIVVGGETIGDWVDVNNLTLIEIVLEL